MIKRNKIIKMTKRKDYTKILSYHLGRGHSYGYAYRWGTGTIGRTFKKIYKKSCKSMQKSREKWLLIQVEGQIH